MAAGNFRHFLFTEYPMPYLPTAPIPVMSSMAHSPGRRRLLGAALASAGLVSVDVRSQGLARVQMQLGWLAGMNQLGEVVAKRRGLFRDEGIDFSIQPGGPNIDGVAIVASGRSALGQVSSSPSVMLAVSQGLPIKCFAVGIQKHPYAFFSLAGKPVRKPADLVGKKVGVQATGAILVRALLAKNGIAESAVEVVTIGADMSPLLTGQVDAVTGWVTSTTALKVLGPQRVDMMLWDAGVRLYAHPYYATTRTLQAQPRLIEAFLRASARGWHWARTHREEAVDHLVREYPNLNREDERQALDMQFDYSFGAYAQAEGWGAMDPRMWQEQIDLYAQLGQFTARKPRVEDVVWMDALNATAAVRRQG